MPACATSGSSSTHGGSPASYSPDCFANNKNILRQGDTFICAVHGTRTVTGGSSYVFTNNLATARNGDAISCGATLTNGETDIEVG